MRRLTQLQQPFVAVRRRTPVKKICSVPRSSPDTLNLRLVLDKTRCSSWCVRQFRLRGTDVATVEAPWHACDLNAGAHPVDQRDRKQADTSRRRVDSEITQARMATRHEQLHDLNRTGKHHEQESEQIMFTVVA